MDTNSAKILEGSYVGTIVGMFINIVIQIAGL